MTENAESNLEELQAEMSLFWGEKPFTFQYLSAFNGGEGRSSWLLSPEAAVYFIPVYIAVVFGLLINSILGDLGTGDVWRLISEAESCTLKSTVTRECIVMGVSKYIVWEWPQLHLRRGAECVWYSHMVFIPNTWFGASLFFSILITVTTYAESEQGFISCWFCIQCIIYMHSMHQHLFRKESTKTLDWSVGTIHWIDQYILGNCYAYLCSFILHS